MYHSCILLYNNRYYSNHPHNHVSLNYNIHTLEIEQKKCKINSKRDIKDIVSLISNK